MKFIAKAIEDSDDDGWANLSGVGSRILGAKPDFDARSYGCPNLSTLVEKSGGFEIRKDHGAVYIRRKAAKHRASPADQARAQTQANPSPVKRPRLPASSACYRGTRDNSQIRGTWIQPCYQAVRK